MTAKTWRIVDAQGVTRTVTAELLIAATHRTSARWRITHDWGRSTADVDADDDTNPCEALCRWAAFRVAEIRGPGELTTAEQLAAAQARIATTEADAVAVCEEYAARQQPTRRSRAGEAPSRDRLLRSIAAREIAALLKSYFAGASPTRGA